MQNRAIDEDAYIYLDFYTSNGPYAVYAASIGDMNGGTRITSQKASPGTTIRSFRVRAGDILDALRRYAPSAPAQDGELRRVDGAWFTAAPGPESPIPRMTLMDDEAPAQDGAERCACVGSIGGPHPTCVMCNGTGKARR